MQMSEIAHPSVFVHTLEPVAFVSTMPSCWQLSLSSEPSPDNPAQCGQGPPHHLLPRTLIPCRPLIEPWGHTAWVVSSHLSPWQAEYEVRAFSQTEPVCICAGESGSPLGLGGCPKFAERFPSGWRPEVHWFSVGALCLHR